MYSWLYLILRRHLSNSVRRAGLRPVHQTRATKCQEHQFVRNRQSAHHASHWGRGSAPPSCSHRFSAESWRTGVTQRGS